MKNVCVYKGQPLKIKPILETLKEQGIPYQVKSKFTLRAVHEWGLNTARDPLQGGGRKDYIDFVFAVPPEELGDCTLHGDFYTASTLTEGLWQVTFPLENMD